MLCIKKFQLQPVQDLIVGAIDTCWDGAKLWQVGKPEDNSDIAEDDVDANAPVTNKVISLATALCVEVTRTVKSSSQAIQ